MSFWAPPSILCWPLHGSMQYWSGPELTHTFPFTHLNEFFRALLCTRLY